MSDEQPDERQIVVEAIESVAPDAQVADLDVDVRLADEVDLDSMDMLNIAAAIYERTGVDIPERDYTRFETLRDFMDFLASAGR
jgi:acyl carrier protein